MSISQITVLIIGIAGLVIAIALLSGPLREVVGLVLEPDDHIED